MNISWSQKEEGRHREWWGMVLFGVEEALSGRHPAQWKESDTPCKVWWRSFEIEETPRAQAPRWKGPHGSEDQDGKCECHEWKRAGEPARELSSWLQGCGDPDEHFGVWSKCDEKLLEDLEGFEEDLVLIVFDLEDNSRWLMNTSRGRNGSCCSLSSRVDGHMPLVSDDQQVNSRHLRMFSWTGDKSERSQGKLPGNSGVGFYLESDVAEVGRKMGAGMCVAFASEGVDLEFHSTHRNSKMPLFIWVSLLSRIPCLWSCCPSCPHHSLYWTHFPWIIFHSYRALVSFLCFWSYN